MNLKTRAVKEMIAAAAHALGGTARLKAWAMEDPKNEYAFWVHIWPRLLPLRVQGMGAHGEIEFNVKLSTDELARELAARNLPSAVFGHDVPVLELPLPEAPRLNGNGQDHPGGGNGSSEP